MKKLLLITVIVLLITASPILAENDDSINVTINGHTVTFNKDLGYPFIDEQNRTLVPLRAIAEAMSLDVTWDPQTNTAWFRGKGRTLGYPIGQKGYWLNDSYQTLDTSSVIINSRTYVPLRSLSEAMNAHVAWLPDSRTIQIALPEVGVNLSHIHYWSSQWMFKDAMKQSWTWWVQDTAEEAWHLEDIHIPLGDDGYPLEIPYKGYQVHTACLMHMDEDGPLYPQGIYTIRFEGQGEILVSGDTPDIILTEADRDHYIPVMPSHEGIHITIRHSSSSDPIHNIQLMMPNFSTSEDNPFHPEFIEIIAPFNVLRYMKTSYVEEFEAVSWDNRTKPDYATQSHMAIGGLSQEYIVLLSNTYDKDPWINVPHGSTDDYVRSLAEFYKNHLDPERQLYIEYSNEPWNPMFPVYDYSIEKGEALGLGYGEEANARYNVVRTLEMQEIFREVYGDSYDGRVTWILNTWSYRREIGTYILDEYDRRQGQVEALAIAPYFGGEIANSIGDGAVIDNDTVIELMEQELRNDIREQIRWHKAEANDRGLRLITYEAGEHFVSLFYPWDQGLKEQMVQVNADERMYDLYQLYWDIWSQEAGDLTVFFNLVEEHNDYGDFGLKQHFWENNSPKWDSVMDIISNSH